MNIYIYIYSYIHTYTCMRVMYVCYVCYSCCIWCFIKGIYIYHVFIYAVCIYIYMCVCVSCMFFPVVHARGGADVALRIYYKNYHIYRTCVRRAPAKPVRARCVRVRCTLAVQDMTCVRPRGNTTPKDFLHTSQ